MDGKDFNEEQTIQFWNKIITSKEKMITLI